MGKRAAAHAFSVYTPCLQEMCIRDSSYLKQLIDGNDVSVLLRVADEAVSVMDVLHFYVPVSYTHLGHHDAALVDNVLADFGIEAGRRHCPDHRAG